MSVHDTDRYDAIRELLEIPEGEPIFILRAQDQLAVGGIRNYMRLGESQGLPREWVEEVRECGNDFMRWQTENPNTVKLPD